MNPKQFLLWAGVLVALVGVLGFVGVIGPTPESSLFGSAWWFDNTENWAHLVLGIVAIAAAYLLPAHLQTLLVGLVGIGGVFLALWNLVSEEFLGAMLQNPLDLLLHLIIGLWALWVAWGDKILKKRSGGMDIPPSMGSGPGAPMA